MTRKVTAEDIIAFFFGAGIVSAIIGFVLHCIVFPICYVIFHDCGKWICEHNYPMTWGYYFLIVGIIWAFLFIITLVGESQAKNSGMASSNTCSSVHGNSNRTAKSRGTSRYKRSYTYPRRNTYHSSVDRETDYYDSDMEGAPGYYGGD